MNLNSERLYLKLLSMNELNGNYISWLNDKEVCKYNSHGEVEYTKEMAASFIKALENDKTKEVYAVYLRETNVHIGNISIQQIDAKNKNAEIAFLFGEKEYWGRGYAKEASEILIRRAFKDLSLHRLYFGTNVDNIAMQKLGERLGFVKEGVLKDAQLKNEKFNDIVIYGKIRH